MPVTAMACTDIPQARKPVDKLAAVGIVKDRAFSFYPDERIFLIVGMK
jgi:hypothetical protein